MTQTQTATAERYEGLTFEEVERRYPKAIVWELQPGKPLGPNRYLTALVRVRVVDTNLLNRLLERDGQALAATH
jgi:hypothetical protein